MATSPSSSFTAFSLALLLLPFVSDWAVADMASDQSECATQLVGLATCLPYVQGNSGAKSPSPDCCGGLKEVLAKSPKCLCVLIKDRDNPQLNIKINVTLALSLPSACNAPANISECPRLLNLPPNSTEAAVFKQPSAGSSAGAQGNSATGSSVKGNSAGAQASGGGTRSHYMGGQGWLGWELAVGLLLILVLPLLADLLTQ